MLLDNFSDAYKDFMNKSSMSCLSFHIACAMYTPVYGMKPFLIVSRYSVCLFHYPVFHAVCHFVDYVPTGSNKRSSAVPLILLLTNFVLSCGAAFSGKVLLLCCSYQVWNDNPANCESVSQSGKCFFLKLGYVQVLENPLI